MLNLFKSFNCGDESDTEDIALEVYELSNLVIGLVFPTTLSFISLSKESVSLPKNITLYLVKSLLAFLYIMLSFLVEECGKRSQLENKNILATLESICSNLSFTANGLCKLVVTVNVLSAVLEPVALALIVMAEDEEIAVIVVPVGMSVPDITIPTFNLPVSEKPSKVVLPLVSHANVIVFVFCSSATIGFGGKRTNG